MSVALSVVSDAKAQKPETVGQRIRRLQAEAKGLARDHVRALCAQLLAAAETAAEIAEGGDAYPPGVRDAARRLVDDYEMRVQTLEAIVART